MVLSTCSQLVFSHSYGTRRLGKDEDPSVANPASATAAATPVAAVAPATTVAPTVRELKKGKKIAAQSALFQAEFDSLKQIILKDQSSASSQTQARFESLEQTIKDQSALSL